LQHNEPAFSNHPVIRTGATGADQEEVSSSLRAVRRSRLQQRQLGKTQIMKLHPNMDEFEFIDAIDASFNFDTDEEYEEVAQMACEISDNAVLMVGYELATQSSHASMEVNLRLLKIIKDTRPTPVVLAALPVIEALLMKDKLPAEYIQRLLDACKQHDNAWNGLGILECADEDLEEICNQIRES
jgi:hypothetical protein